MALEKKRIELEKGKFNLAKDVEKLKQLKSDRELMEVRAPASGVVYYGRCVRGKWVSVTGTGARNIAVGKTIPAKREFLTIVRPDQVFVRADLTEEDLGWVRQGMTGIATTPVFPGKRMRSEVRSLSFIPVSPGNYDAQFALVGAPANMMPGMKCQIKMKAYENPQAITVPSKAVFTEDDMNFFVYVQDGEGKPERRAVTRGKTFDGTTEITTGLTEGEIVRLSKP